MPSPSDRTAGATEDAPDGGGEDATATVTPAVAVREVTHRYGRGADAVTALGPLSLDIPAGEFLVLVGPSGSGKSTLLRLIAGFEQASSGEVTVHGRTPEPGRQAGVVFQQPRLFPWRTVGENISLALRYAGVPRAERPAHVEELLERVGLAGTAGRRTWQMSGGQQQRVAIARALAGGKDLLVLDEPFAALDALTRERLQEYLRTVSSLTGITSVFVTHSVDEAVFLGTRAVVLSAGPGTVALDVPIPLPRTGSDDPDGLRGLPEYAPLRAEIGAAVRDAAR
ncbi:ABC transporter ATP-binding protein [Streptomyces sp. ME02-6979-3A]|uniref:ABC transporter ATP-binding protein n=1 Tax=Streptomyces silvae TaxID=2803812 RepID=A0ABU7ZWW9_9ACTN|nr:MULTISPECIES: ABC transporter ATP-binding protein [unclassified Streptomyces]MDX3328129.1 ABC transporter ATP-binding protein [Streptomyces sp. ME02-6979-3A]MDX3687897.1 ABC transporter ATP-binding protein [Streptomyces sp. AK04-4c]